MNEAVSDAEIGGPDYALLTVKKTLNRRVNQALEDCNSGGQGQAWEKLFQYYGHDCLLPRSGSKLEESVL